MKRTAGTGLLSRQELSRWGRIEKAEAGRTEEGGNPTFTEASDENQEELGSHRIPREFFVPFVCICEKSGPACMKAYGKAVSPASAASATAVHDALRVC